MIAVDTSVLVAILLQEADAPRLSRVLADRACRVGAPNLFETMMVVQRHHGENVTAAVATLLSATGLFVEPWTAEHALLAHDAFRRFGKGRHPAALNFGDCMAYAVARAADAPLLFKGEDFRRTDVRPAA